MAPRYQDIRAGEVALLSSPDGGALVRVIAGEVAGHAGPGATHTPMAMAHVTVSPGARVVLPWAPDHNALLYVLAGEGSVGTEGRPVRAGQLVVFGPGDTVVAQARDRQDSRTPAFEALVLGGRPIHEPVVQYGPFVMNTRAEIAQALEDFQHGKLGTIPADHIG